MVFSLFLLEFAIAVGIIIVPAKLAHFFSLDYLLFLFFLGPFRISIDPNSFPNHRRNKLKTIPMPLMGCKKLKDISRQRNC
jgi:hypothetical protein